MTPTLTADDLADPAQFLTLRGVPVFVTHEALDPPGPAREPRRTAVDRATLERLARQTNARTSGRAFMPAKLQIGHTLPKKPLVVNHRGQLQAVAAPPEGAQPAVMGFATNWRVGDEGERPELYCDWHLFHSDVPYARTFPYASIEREPEEYISAVALLRTEPALALGTMHYAKVWHGSAAAAAEPRRSPRPSAVHARAVLAVAMETGTTVKEARAILSARHYAKTSAAAPAGRPAPTDLGAVLEVMTATGCSVLEAKARLRIT